MTVETLSAQYQKVLPQWRRCRDAIAGQDAVHAAGELYLPKLSGQDAIKYRSYQRRSEFLNASSRTVDGLSGMVLGKDADREIPDGMDDLLADITLTGIDLRDFIDTLLSDQISVGRIGVLVDYPDTAAEGVVSVSAARALNRRPYARQYPAESITNWRTAARNGEERLSMVTLMEDVDEPLDEFTCKVVRQYRVLDMFGGAYRQRVFRRVEVPGAVAVSWVPVSEQFPLMNGRVMGYIPFLILNAGSMGAAVQRPPLLDLVDTNLSHYRTSADWEHALHFTALPTPVVAGVQLEEGQSLHIGSTDAWVLPDPSAKAYYMEFTGQGLQSLEKALAMKERRMAILGARMLDLPASGRESTETIRIRYNGEHAVLSNLARACSSAIEQMLVWMRDWSGASGAVRYRLNTEYVGIRMDANEVTALVQSWQAGAISREALFWNLKRSEFYSEGTEYAEETALATAEMAVRESKAAELAAVGVKAAPTMDANKNAGAL